MCWDAVAPVGLGCGLGCGCRDDVGRICAWCCGSPLLFVLCRAGGRAAAAGVGAVDVAVPDDNAYVLLFPFDFSRLSEMRPLQNLRWNIPESVTD